MTSIQSDAIRVRFCSHLLDNLLCRNGCKSVICRETEIRSLASLPTFAAFAQKNWFAAPCVRFVLVAQFGLRLLRMSTLRPSRRWQDVG
jgi:hypothetical protein